MKCNAIILLDFLLAILKCHHPDYSKGGHNIIDVDIQYCWQNNCYIWLESNKCNISHILNTTLPSVS